jgi:hypothetical protein
VFIVIATSYARPVVQTLPPRWTGRGVFARETGGQRKYLGPKKWLLMSHLLSTGLRRV